MLILIEDGILLTNSDSQSRDAKTTGFWTRVVEISMQYLKSRKTITRYR
jgi:hypothetical protein